MSLNTQQSNEFSQKAWLRFGLSASVQQVFNAGLDLLFPPQCPGCGRVDTYWCEYCDYEVSQQPFPASVITLHPLVAVATTAYHTGKVQKAIHTLKYENGKRLAIPLGNRLAARTVSLEWTIDTLIPVPLHTGRLLERGYNQSQLLCEQIARLLNIPVDTRSLYRHRQTRTQVGLNAEQRRVNMQQAFSVETLSPLQGQCVLLVDDVFTTGATMSTCAEALVAAGVQQVYGITVSSTLR